MPPRFVLVGLSFLLFLGCQEIAVEPCLVIHHDLAHDPEAGESLEELEEGLRPYHGVYTAEIEVGSPGQISTVIMDTGSANLFLNGPNCPTCKTIDYRPSESSTSQPQNETLNVAYGSGALTAQTYTDVLGLPCGDRTEVTFGVTTKSANVGSILGLAYPNLATSASTPITPWFDAMVNAGILEDLFTMRLCGVDRSGSHLKLGGMDETISTDALKYTAITDESYYVIAPARLSVNGTETGTTGEGKTIVDSGTTLVLLPSDAHRLIHQQLEAAAELAGLKEKIPDGFWDRISSDISVHADLTEADIKTFPPVMLSIPGSGEAESIDLEMKPQRYFRKGSGGVYFGIRAHHGALAILGQVFMENFDVVFDRANKRIGFAPIQGCGN